LALPKVVFRFKFKKMTLTKIGWVRFWFGFIAVGFSIMFLIGGIVALQIYSIFDESTKSLSEGLEKLAQEERARSVSSFGWVYIAIGIGLFFTGVQFILDALDRRIIT
jgi:hypothetical protein